MRASTTALAATKSVARLKPVWELNNRSISATPPPNHQTNPQANNAMAAGASNIFRSLTRWLRYHELNNPAPAMNTVPRYWLLSSGICPAPLLQPSRNATPAANCSTMPKARASQRDCRAPIQTMAAPSNAQVAAVQRPSNAKGIASVPNNTPSARKASTNRRWVSCLRRYKSVAMAI